MLFWWNGVRSLVIAFFKFAYRFRMEGAEHVPASGRVPPWRSAVLKRNGGGRRALLGRGDRLRKQTIRGNGKSGARFSALRAGRGTAYGIRRAASARIIRGMGAVAAR